MALVASQNGAADDAHVARRVGRRLEHRFVGQDMVHHAPAPRGRLKRQIIVWLGPHGLAVHFDLNGVDGRIARTKTQLFAVLAGRVFRRAVAEFDEKHNVRLEVVFWWFGHSGLPRDHKIRRHPL